MTRSLTASVRIPLAALALVLAWPSPPAHAGCGCDKAPPAPAAARPNVTYAGMPVAFFSSTFIVGTAYTVVFTSGTTGETASVGATVVNLRDMATATYTPQIVVSLPVLPLGPTSITVTRNGAAQPELTITDANFTVAPTPVAVPYAYGYWQYPNSQAAVGRNGVTYLSLDLSGVTNPLIFQAYMGGYPLSFGAGNVTFYNTQGFLMQLIVNTTSRGTTPVGGMFVIPPPTTADSNVLWYSRHEFSTYFLQHLAGQPHATDPTDANWHVDGSRHVDHNHVILAIAGKLNGVAPAAGATPAFNLMVKAQSLFFAGLTGTGGVTMSTSAISDSLDSNTNLFGSGGDVFTLSTLRMSSPSTVKGDATAKTFSVATTGATITGTRYLANPATSFLLPILPTGIPSLGSISLSGTTVSRTIYGPGTFLVSSITLKSGATLFIDNTAGPVTLYVTGAVAVSGATIQTADPKPDKFSIYVTGTSSVGISTTTSFRGVVYAPNSAISLTGAGNFTGAFLGKTLAMSSSAHVHFDSSLSGKF